MKTSAKVRYTLPLPPYLSRKRLDGLTSAELQISFCPLPAPRCLFACLSSLPPQKGKEDLHILSGYITALHACYSFSFAFSPGDICILLAVVCRLFNESRHSCFGWNGSFQTTSLKGLACKRKRQKEQ
jgi:hypothetical protein